MTTMGKLHPVHAEQERYKCCCRHISARECIRARNPSSYYTDPWDVDDACADYEDDECSCACHDADVDEDDL